MTQPGRLSIAPGALRAAVLGTQAGPPQVASGDAVIDAFLLPHEREEPERGVLRAAALLATIERIATPPIVFDEARPAAVLDLNPRCGPLATLDLRTILADSASGLLPEWLALARRYGRRPPEETLPALLERGAQSVELRAAVRAVVDARGWWLASQNPRWTYASRERDPIATFEEGDSAAGRTEALRELRAVDAGAARRRLEAAWPSESPADRAVLLAALRTGLSLDDEIFLERANADKRREVRLVAADLLLRCPGTAASARAIEVARPFVRLDECSLKLVIEPPEQMTPGMERDGVSSKPLGSYAGGVKAWLLEQSLARVPPAFWRESLHLSTTELFERARDDAFGEPAMRGFALAIERYRDREALADLLRLASHEPVFLPHLETANHDALEVAFRERLLRDALDDGRAEADRLVFTQHAPWSIALSRSVLTYARGMFERPVDWSNRRAVLMRELARRVHPETPGIERGWPESYATAAIRSIVEETLALTAFRIAMSEHFADDV